MKVFSKLVVLVTAIVLFACAEEKKEPILYKVNSAKLNCEGVAPMSCLQVQKGEGIDSDNWEMFYSNIEGFDYQAGYLYTLLIQEEDIPLDKIPADGSSIKFTLVEIVEQMPDPLLAIHDIYVATEVLGVIVSYDSTFKSELPSMEINVTERRIMGKDGCNNYNGAIAKLTTTEISFGPIASTQMMCPDMSTPDAFNQALSLTAFYEKVDGGLQLKDSEQNIVISLKKID